MKCEKEGYSKGHAYKLRRDIYKRSHRSVKLRIYECPECHVYHLTSRLKDL